VKERKGDGNRKTEINKNNQRHRQKSRDREAVKTNKLKSDGE
jgi:hypothetical protein